MVNKKSTSSLISDLKREVDSTRKEIRFWERLRTLTKHVDDIATFPVVEVKSTFLKKLYGFQYELDDFLRRVFENQSKNKKK